MSKIIGYLILSLLMVSVIGVVFIEAWEIAGAGAAFIASAILIVGIGLIVLAVHLITKD
jgi:hypothetical protein